MTSNYCKRIYEWFGPALMNPKELKLFKQKMAMTPFDNDNMWLGVYTDRTFGTTIRTLVALEISETASLDEAEKKFNRVLIQKWHEQKPVWVA